MDLEQMREMVKRYAIENLQSSSDRIKGWSHNPRCEMYVHYSGNGRWNEWGMFNNEISYWDGNASWIPYKGNGINRHTINNSTYLTWLWTKLNEK